MPTSILDPLVSLLTPGVLAVVLALLLFIALARLYLVLSSSRPTQTRAKLIVGAGTPLVGIVLTVALLVAVLQRTKPQLDLISSSFSRPPRPCFGFSHSFRLNWVEGYTPEDTAQLRLVLFGSPPPFAFRITHPKELVDLLPPGQLGTDLQRVSPGMTRIIAQEYETTLLSPDLQPLLRSFRLQPRSDLGIDLYFDSFPDRLVAQVFGPGGLREAVPLPLQVPSDPHPALFSALKNSSVFPNCAAPPVFDPSGP